MNIGLTCTSIALFLLFAEFGLRITGLQTVKPNPPLIYQNSENPDIGYELRPNLKNIKAFKARVSTDDAGFRLNGKRKVQSGTLLAVLGDSITFGYGVNDTEALPAQLENQLSINHYPLSILNAAIPGYQLEQQTATYIEKIAPLNPDAVMLVFYWNDLDGLPPAFVDDQGILRPHGWQPREQQCDPIQQGILGKLPGRCWLDTHSAFYKAFKKLYSLQQSKKQKVADRTEEKVEGQKEPFTEEAVRAYRDQLQAFSKLLPEERYFVIWPDHLAHTEHRNTLLGYSAQFGFTVIDLYELFGTKAETLPWDTVHPSPKALEEAAIYISEQMRL